MGKCRWEKESGKRAGAHDYNKYVHIDCSKHKSS